jgi:hypothetical protein
MVACQWNYRKMSASVLFHEGECGGENVEAGAPLEAAHSRVGENIPDHLRWGRLSMKTGDRYRVKVSVHDADMTPHSESRRPRANKQPRSGARVAGLTGQDR